VGITGGGDMLNISDNEISGHDEGCIQTLAYIADAQVVVNNNSCQAQGRNARITTAVIDFVANGMTSGSAFGNEIIGENSAATVYGIDCNNNNVNIVGGSLIDPDNHGIIACPKVSNMYIDGLAAGVAIVAQSAGDLDYRDNEIIGVAGGIYITNGDGSIISGNDILATADPIELITSDDVVITGNNLNSASNGKGIVITTCDDVVITDSVVIMAGWGDALELEASDRCVVSNNRFDAGSHANDIGIDANDVQYCVITGNMLESTNDAIETDSSTYLIVKDNLSYTSGKTFDLDGGTGSVAVDNVVTP